MTRHGKNCTAGAVYTYHEKKKDTAASGYGTQNVRLSRDAVKDFDCCCLSLQPCHDPVVTPDGFLYEREAILEYILHQKREIARQMKAYEKQRGAQQEERRELSRAAAQDQLRGFLEKEAAIVSRPLNPFTPRTGAGPGPSSTPEAGDKDKAKELPSFWIPSLTPEAKASKLEKPVRESSPPHPTPVPREPLNPPLSPPLLSLHVVRAVTSRDVSDVGKAPAPVGPHLRPLHPGGQLRGPGGADHPQRALRLRGDSGQPEQLHPLCRPWAFVSRGSVGPGRRGPRSPISPLPLPPLQGGRCDHGVCGAPDPQGHGGPHQRGSINRQGHHPAAEGERSPEPVAAALALLPLWPRPAPAPGSGHPSPPVTPRLSSSLGRHRLRRFWGAAGGQEVPPRDAGLKGPGGGGQQDCCGSSKWLIKVLASASPAPLPAPPKQPDSEK
uniref:Nitric oxide synthase-interacting protein n=1 Tax=Sarcophilus harrisii TaxID=9305 RepID=A0A7N4V568_SARHA